MQIKVITAALGVAAFCAAPLLASADSVNYGSIELLSAQVTPDQPLQNSEFIGNFTSPHQLHVSFVNHGSVAATDIQFETTGEKDQIVDDKGTFAPNATINQTLSNVGRAGDAVQIVGVHYADGTTWTGTPVQPLRQAEDQD